MAGYAAMSWNRSTCESSAGARTLGAARTRSWPAGTRVRSTSGSSGPWFLQRFRYVDRWWMLTVARHRWTV